MTESYVLSDLRAMVRFGTGLAFRLKPGMVLALSGDLGAGKTTLVQSLAQAYGIQRVITSPTFSIVSEYAIPSGGLLVHMDLYRLAQADSLWDIGFQEYLERGARVAIEWPERAEALLQPYRVLRVELAHGAMPSERIAKVIA